MASFQGANIHDLRLPEPFHQPAGWQNPQMSKAGLWLLPLDLATATGGALRTYFKKVLSQQADHVAWSFHVETFEREEHLKNEALHWLKATHQPLRFHIESGDVADLARIFSLKQPFDVLKLPLEEAGPRAEVWLKTLAPEALASVRTEVSIQALLKEYEESLGRAVLFPWLDLGYFSGFLRRKDQQELAERLNLEWTRAHVMYSPHDEEREKANLAAHELMLNPTLQIIRKEREGKKEVRLLARWKESLSEILIGPAEAVFVDELHESARVQTNELAKMYHKNSELKAAFENLLSSGIILSGPTQPIRPV